MTMPISMDWLTTTGTVLTLLLLIGLNWRLLRWVNVASKQAASSTAEQVNRLLPQTQCGQCGFNGCAPYAQAIAKGSPINRCPPGGSDTISALAFLLDRPAIPLDPELGGFSPPHTVHIREDECIGCTKCIQACPVDAILGAARLMHTVIASQCTGCDLCIEPCPVDCIDLVETTNHGSTWPVKDFGIPTGVVNA